MQWASLKLFWHYQLFSNDTLKQIFDTFHNFFFFHLCPASYIFLLLLTRGGKKLILWLSNFASMTWTFFFFSLLLCSRITNYWFQMEEGKKYHPDFKKAKPYGYFNHFLPFLHTTTRQQMLPKPITQCKHSFPCLTGTVLGQDRLHGTDRDCKSMSAACGSAVDTIW